jgi:hypothetical protein
LKKQLLIFCFALLQGHAGHWFMGGGMVHGVSLRDGRTKWYHNRWVRTPRFAEAPTKLGTNETLIAALCDAPPGSLLKSRRGQRHAIDLHVANPDRSQDLSKFSSDVGPLTNGNSVLGQFRA